MTNRIHRIYDCCHCNMRTENFMPFFGSGMYLDPQFYTYSSVDFELVKLYNSPLTYLWKGKNSGATFSFNTPHLSNSVGLTTYVSGLVNNDNFDVIYGPYTINYKFMSYSSPQLPSYPNRRELWTIVSHDGVSISGSKYINNIDEITTLTTPSVDIYNENSSEASGLPSSILQFSSTTISSRSLYGTMYDKPIPSGNNTIQVKVNQGYNKFGFSAMSLTRRAKDKINYCESCSNPNKYENCDCRDLSCHELNLPSLFLEIDGLWDSYNLSCDSITTEPTESEIDAWLDDAANFIYNFYDGCGSVEDIKTQIDYGTYTSTYAPYNHCDYVDPITIDYCSPEWMYNLIASGVCTEQLSYPSSSTSSSISVNYPYVASGSICSTINGSIIELQYNKELCLYQSNIISAGPFAGLFIFTPRHEVRDSGNSYYCFSNSTYPNMQPCVAAPICKNPDTNHYISGTLSLLQISGVSTGDCKAQLPTLLGQIPPYDPLIYASGVLYGKKYTFNHSTTQSGTVSINKIVTSYIGGTCPDTLCNEAYNIGFDVLSPCYLMPISGVVPKNATSPQPTWRLYGV